MKKKMMPRLLSVILVLCMVLAWALPAAAADAKVGFTQVDNDRVTAGLHSQEKADGAEEEENYAPTDIVRVSIFLDKAGTLEAGYDAQNIANNNAAMAYREKLEKEQAAMVAKIEKIIGGKLDVVWNITLAANFISANVAYGKLDSIRAIDGVKSVTVELPAAPDVVDKGGNDLDMTTSAMQIGSAPAYAAGLTGAGSRIAIIDSGLDVDHRSFDAGAYLYSLSLLAEKAGMDVEEYIESLDLLDAAEIAQVLPQLNIGAKLGASPEDIEAQAEQLAAVLTVNEKVPFGFNYVDVNVNLSHLYDTGSEHGSHVAGITAANAYVPDGEGYANALETVYTQGVAPDAQLIVMKVFGENGGAYDSDYMVAIEDAIILGADAINLSLGSDAPGASGISSEEYQEIFDSLEHCGVVVSISAGNSGHWISQSENGVPYLYLDDVSMHTSGSPGTYTNSLGVASVNNAGITALYIKINGNYITYSESTGYTNEPIVSVAGEQEYVFLNGIGTPEEFAALNMDLTGKVVMCYRGETSFYEKANAAAACGAKAVIIVNNQPGTILMDLTGYSYTVPTVSISQVDGEYFKDTPIMDGETVLGWTGTMNISDSLKAVSLNEPYYTVSDFSSWGVPGSLLLKPEITAPGGNIYSVGGAYSDGKSVIFGDHASYENMSGTSMAAPQVAGMAALMAQYIREAGLEDKTGLDARTLSQSLLMSTAEPILDGNNGGYYYPVIQQGAGLGNVGNAIMADSYILMNADATASYADGKVKVELGDDPDRNGVYTFSFTINNMTDEEKVYALYADMFTQGVASDGEVLYMDTFTKAVDHIASWTVDGKPMEGGAEMDGMDFNGDGYVNTADGQTLLDYATGLVTELTNKAMADLDDDGKVNSYDAYLFFKMLGQCGATVAANGSVAVSVTITLTEDAKETLDAYYTSGAYIEGYVYAESMTSAEGVEGTCHSIPVLGFYGNWSDASMFDKGSYWDYASGEETRAPYLYESNGIGGNALLLSPSYDPNNDYYFGGNPMVSDAVYMPERNAFSTTNGDTLSGVAFTAIRAAAAAYIQVWDAETGEVYTREEVNVGDMLSPAYFSSSRGYWVQTQYSIGFGDLGLGEIPEGTRVAVGVTLIPEYYVDAEGEVDWDALGDGVTYSMEMTLDSTAPVLEDVAYSLMHNTLNLTATDNQYIAAVALFDEYGQYLYTYEGSDATAAVGETMNYALDLTGVNGAKFLVQVYDYAGNVATYELDMDIGEVTDEIDSIAVEPGSVTIQKGSTAALTATVYPVNASDRSFTWSSDDETVAVVDEHGVVLGVGEGTTTVTATSNADPTVSASCTVHIIDIQVDLNAIVWDEEGSIYFSEFNTATLPNYTKLSPDMLDVDYLTSAAIGPNGILYASSLNTSTGTGNMYAVIPETWDTILLDSCSVQGVDIFYSDLTYASAMFGTGMLLGGYGPYMIAIDPATGSSMGILDQYHAEIVGVASVSGGWNSSMEMYIDIVLVALSDGSVCIEYYLTDDMYYYGAYYYKYMEYRNGFHTDVDVDGALYFNSVYYDGDYLFWSMFNEETDNAVTLFAIDMNTGETINLGNFADGVWPVGGLFQMSGNGTSGAGIDQFTIEDDVELQVHELVTELPVAEQEFIKPNATATHSPAGSENKTVTVDITAKDAQGVNVATHNGVATVTFDTAAFTLKNIVVKGDYVSVNMVEDGTVTFGYVDLEGIKADEVIATLVLVPKTEEDSQVHIKFEETNNAAPNYTEKLDVIFAKQDNTNPPTGEYLPVRFGIIVALCSVSMLAVLVIFRKKVIC